MALDEPQDADEIIEDNGFQFLINKQFLKKAQPIKVDFLVTGFKLDCAIKFEDTCKSCATDTSCCST